MQEFYGKYKPRYIFYTGFTPRVFHSKPEHIQYIVNSTVHVNKSDSFQVLSYWIGEGIITSNGRCLYLLSLLLILPKTFLLHIYLYKLLFDFLYIKLKTIAHLIALIILVKCITHFFLIQSKQCF